GRGGGTRRRGGMLAASRSGRSRRIALARPARSAAGASQLIFQICDLLFRLLGFHTGVLELHLSGSDLRTELIFAIVDVASVEQLAVQVLHSQVEKLGLFFSA